MIISKSTLFCRIRIAAVVVAISFAPLSQAQYRLSVFDEARAHDELKNNDLASAEAAFEKPALDPLDYADLNNLCVLQIVARETADATRSCRRALNRIRNKTIRLRDKREMRAVVLTNLSVALALQGDLTAAEESIERALVLDSDNEEAQRNRAAFSLSRVASRM